MQSMLGRVILVVVFSLLYRDTNVSENMTNQNLCDAAKAALRGNFTAIQSYSKKQEKSQINKLTLHLKQLDIFNMSCHSPMSSRVPAEESAVNFMWIHLYVFVAFPVDFIFFLSPFLSFVVR